MTTKRERFAAWIAADVERQRNLRDAEVLVRITERLSPKRSDFNTVTQRAKLLWGKQLEEALKKSSYVDKFAKS